MPIVLNGDTGIVTPTYGGTDTSEYLVPVTAFKNRIINGAMQIDQRNAGASVTINTSSRTYTLDRFLGQGTTSSGVFTVQRSTTAPAGFTNSLLATVTTIDSSLAAGDIYTLAQDIEGFNCADLGFGTASASTVTLSFWVRSSVTGTFGGSLGNNAFNRAYPFTYTISSANTWEQKTITIAGDTTGTWATDNSIGLRIYLSLGTGSTYAGTAGAWTGSGLITATGATNLMATNGATFYITGVQLEKGSTATSFDYRPYGTELALCQRYYQQFGGEYIYQRFGSGLNHLTTQNISIIPFFVPMRAAPTLGYSSISHFAVWNGASVITAATGLSLDNSTTVNYGLTTTVASGLAAGSYGQPLAYNTLSARLTFSAEL
jgi:hypothetical protein